MTASSPVKHLKGKHVFSLPEAARHFGIPLLVPKPGEISKGASIDTRTLRPGDCFFALSGTQIDGHLFLEKAFLLGASGAVISEAYFRTSLSGCSLPSGFKNILVVEDPAQMLADLAAWHRSRFSIPFIGITGSVGKTSTKEFLRYLLQTASSDDAVLATKGNLNNHLGLPLTLLELNSNHRFCVTELGANAPGDIALLCNIVKPTAAILTCVAPVHLEGFGSLEAIHQTKTDLFRSLSADAPAVTSYGDPRLDIIVQKLPLKVLRAGFDPKSDGLISEVLVEDGWVSFLFRGRYRFSFPGIASFLTLNAGMALLMAESLGISLDSIPSRWAGFSLPDGRFSMKDIGGGVRVIYDGYNASPKSFEKALETFKLLPVKGRRVVVFSDMRELGENSKLFHRALGEWIAENGMDAAFAYGQESLGAIESFGQKLPKGIRNHFPGPEELSEHLAGYLQPGDVILLKASRGMKIERVLQTLQKDSRFASFSTTS